MAIANWTLQQVLNQLDSGSTWSGSIITYAFPTSALDMKQTEGERNGFTAFSTTQITFAQYAISLWDDLMSSDFSEVAGGGSDVEFGNTTTGIDYAHAYYPDWGSVWLNPDYDDVKQPKIGDYGFSTILHELGHAIGLDHMGDYNGANNNGPSSYQDSSVLSIMSYYGPDNFDGEGQVMWADWVRNGTTYSAQTPMVNDVYAIQAMYGVETTTRTGDTVYGFNSNITGTPGLFLDFSRNSNPILTIFDSGGEDTLDLSGYSSASRISLVAGSYSDANQMTYNIGIAYSATIENAVGGSGNDDITGNSANNKLTGGRGNDTIDGGAGTDTAVFSGTLASYTVTSLGSGAYTVTDNTGNDGTDTLSNIEILQFSDQIYSGSAGAPQLQTAIADQTVDTGAFFFLDLPANTFTDPDGDILTFTATLSNGSSLPSWLSFDAATLTFSGTPTDANSGTISVQLTASDGSETASDVFNIVIGDDDGGVSDVIKGTGGKNKLTGTGADETLLGLGGNDKLKGQGGDDILDGGKGRDLLWGGKGADIFAFGNKNGMDDIYDFSEKDGDQIDLSDVKAIKNYSDLVKNHLSDWNGDAYIQISGKHDILIYNIDSNDLDKGDFIF